MSRKHFEMIANIVKDIPDEQIRKETAEKFASELRSLNANFNKHKFMIACNAD